MYCISLLYLLPFLCVSFPLFSQDTACCYSLNGKIAYKHGGNLTFSIISLHNVKDSVGVASAITDSSGNFHFGSIPKGEYLIGLQQTKNRIRFFSGKYVVTSSRNDLYIEIDDSVKLLEKVIVTSSKPFLQRESDRLVINLESSTLTRGNSLLEALPRLPGIDILHGNTVTVNGNPDVLLIIDGKSYKAFSPQALQLLTSLRSDNIEKIEIFTTPPAKFEAEGSSIINVVLKKDKAFSTIDLTYGQRVYPLDNKPGTDLNIFSTGGNFFYSLGKFRFNTAINYTDNASSFTKEENFYQFSDGKRDNASLITSTARNLFLNLTANYSVGQHTFGLTYSTANTLSTNISSFDEDRFFTPTDTLRSAYISNINTHVKNSNPVWLLSYDNLLNKTKNQTLSIALIIGNYSNNYDIFRTQTMLPPLDSSYAQYQNFTISSKAIKMDYAQRLKKLGRFETGFKFTRANNNDNYAGDSVSLFKFQETIQAIYLNMANTIQKKFTYTAGIRMERTTNDATSSETPHSTIKRDYIDLFPSFSLQYPVTPKSKLGLAYSRRIARPSYNNFNPANFITFNDPFSNQQGNANLKPQYLTKIELSFKNGNFYSAATYTHKSNIRTILGQENSDQSITYTTDNVSGSDVNLLASYSHKFSTWFESGLNASGQYYFYRLVDQSTVQSFTCRLSSNQSITFSPEFKSDISIRYYSPFRMDYSRLAGFYTIDAGVSKSIFHKYINLNFSVNDITGSSKAKWTYVYPDFFKISSPLSNERHYRLSISYRFKTGNKFQLKRKQTDEFGENRFYN